MPQPHALHACLHLMHALHACLHLALCKHASTSRFALMYNHYNLHNLRILCYILNPSNLSKLHNLSNLPYLQRDMARVNRYNSQPHMHYPHLYFLNMSLLPPQANSLDPHDRKFQSKRTSLRLTDLKKLCDTSPKV